MGWDAYGARTPRQTAQCPSQCGLCSAVCPFGEHGISEDDLSAELFADDEMERTALGNCLGAYVGYVTKDQFRAEGSSGGLARWFLSSLLSFGHVDRVMCVVPGTGPDDLFHFADIDSPEGLWGASRSAYYPTDLAEVLGRAADARYAVIGLPCVIKGVRLAARRIPRIAEKIYMTAGLVCGQLKTRAFVEHLARTLDIAPENVRRISFREKQSGRPANNFDVVLDSETGGGSLPFVSAAYSGTWVSDQFRLRACTLCDDVFAETADVAFMDAWLPEYINDPLGTSIVVTRSEAAQSVIREGIARQEVQLEPIAVEEVLRSQAARIANKRYLLARRLWMLHDAGEPCPSKRTRPVKPTWHERLVLVARERVRAASHEAIKHQQELAPQGLKQYNLLMRTPLRRLMLIRAFAPGNLKNLPAAIARRIRKLFGASARERTQKN